MNALTTTNEHCDVAIDHMVLGELVCVRALVKVAFAQDHGKWLRAPARPLRHDYRPNTRRQGSKEALLLPTCEFFGHKPWAELWVRGHAYAPKGKPCNHIQVTLNLAQRCIALRVSGERYGTRLTDGSVEISSAKPFEHLPLVWNLTYGGTDFTCQPRNEMQALEAACHIAHPGTYPRNPYGLGYRQNPTAADPWPLPSIEEVTQTLDGKKLRQLAALPWWHHPRPLLFEPMPFDFFPRCTALGTLPALLPSDAHELPEVANGEVAQTWLSEDLRAMQDDDEDEIPANFEPRMHQGVHPLLCFSSKPSESQGCPIFVSGMHPDEARLGFVVPQAPAFELFQDHRPLPGQTHLQTVEFMPELKIFTLTYEVLASLARPILAEISDHVEIRLNMDGHEVGRFGD